MVRKILKISGIVLASLAALFLAVFAWLWFSTASYRLDEAKLKLNFEMTSFYDDADAKIERNASEAVKLDEIPDDTVRAFIATEDREFYRHKGVNLKRIAGATLRNIQSFSFKEGGSTISQQLIKNTHLSNEKTIKRKFAELRLTRELEEKYSKEQILELYLNSIYFGKCGYGIANAAKGFFGKDVSELSLAEGASLAGVIKSPSLYSPYLHYEKFLSRRNLVLKLMLDQEMINDSQYESSISETFDIKDTRANPNLAYLNGALDECSSLLKLSENQINNLGLKIYTNLNAGQQKTLEKVSKQQISTAQYCANIDNTVVLLDNRNGSVAALFSTNSFCCEQKRQPASAIKPLLVYGPALENNLIEPATLLDDRKESIGGFFPSNYHDKYYGPVSARFALANSLNIPAVRLMSDLGVERAMKYLKANGMEVSKESYHLASALGGFADGVTLVDLCNGYQTLANGGTYRKAAFVRKIVDRDGRTVFESGQTETKDSRNKISGSKETQVFSEQTAFLLNDMLSETVKSGTGKALRSLGIPLCAKTGTNGTETGNRDVYSISYNSAFTVGVWLGSDDLFDNSVTGGTTPTLAARSIWQALIADWGISDADLTAGKLKSEWGFEVPDGICRRTVDAETLKNDRKFELADENAPEDCRITDYFQHDVTEQSHKYSCPETRDFKTTRNNDRLTAKFFGEKRFSYEIYDLHSDGTREFLFECDGKNSEESFTTEALSGRHCLEIVAVFREKDIEGSPQKSEEFIFSCSFIPDGKEHPDQNPDEDPDGDKKGGKDDSDGEDEDESPDDHQDDDSNDSPDDAWWW